MDRKYDHTQLKNFSTAVFEKMGMTGPHARQAADVLVRSDLRGIDSHGVARLSGYVRLWEKDRLNVKPVIKTIHESPSTAVIDGDNGVGLVVAPHAMRMAIKKARTAGTGWVAVKNSNHFGIAGYHAMMALEHHMIGLALTNASPVVAPTFSIEGLLGTNPIAIAIPAGKHPPFVLDMATTTVANGKLEILQRLNKPTPQGWVQDKEGNPTTNASALKEGGTLLPLGSDLVHSSYKGYALGAMVDILSAVLSGANYGPWVPPFVPYLEPRTDLVGEGIGHFLGAMRVDAFRPADEFRQHMDTWIDRFRNARVAGDGPHVKIPGDPEREMEDDRGSNGIPLNEKVANDLIALAEKLRVPPLETN